MDVQSLTYDMCRSYVLDQKGLIDDDILDQVLGWIRSKDIVRLSSPGDFIPQAYSFEDLCRFSRQVSAFFKKNPAFSDSLTCKTAAELAFFKAETNCRITNKRLDYYYSHEDRIDPEIAAVINRSQHIIADVLGDFGAFLDGLPSRMRVTAGASASRSRLQSLPYLKMRLRDLPTTQGCIPYLKALATFYGFKKIGLRTTTSNRVETVPKNWKTDRTIACEPEGNLFLQTAFDDFVKDQLFKVRVDLSDQFKNQKLSKEGSVTGEYATIDLSMASDTVSLNTVAYLFPPRWYKFLTEIRSPFGVGFGRRFRYAKLSSMGNGATFSVETLIFASLCKAVGAKNYAVYGDDIVIPVGCVPLLIRLLRFLGFRLNESKSYTSGPFRESCGTDWFNGKNVTPFYFRMNSDSMTELCHLVNGMAGVCNPGGLLEAMLLDLVENQKLPLVPHNSSSISGVWIDPHSAYSEKLIQTKFCIPGFLGFIPKTRRRRISDSRTLFLWHLDAARRKDGKKIGRPYHPFLTGYGIPMNEDDVDLCIIRSEVPIFTHKYVRKWVRWISPAVVTPFHLYGWSEQLIRRKAG